MYDVIILGAGPAGLSAAVYAKRARLNALLIEKGGAGGQVLSTYEVDNYPGLPGVTGMELGQIFSQHADKFGIEKVTAEVIAIAAGEGKKIVKTNQGDYETAAVIIATGAKHARLGLEKENELTGMGVSYCATCDGAFYKDKTVAIIGGGNTALQEANMLADSLKKVYVIQNLEFFTGEKNLVKRLGERDNVEVILSTVVTDIIGDESFRGIKIKNTDSGNTRELYIDGMFVAIGQVPENEPFKNNVPLNGYGYIESGEDCIPRGAKPGIFVAGDCRTKAIRQVTTATADGAVAALAACRFVDSIK